MIIVSNIILIFAGNIKQTVNHRSANHNHIFPVAPPLQLRIGKYFKTFKKLLFGGDGGRLGQTGIGESGWFFLGNKKVGNFFFFFIYSSDRKLISGSEHVYQAWLQFSVGLREREIAACAWD